MSAFAMPTAAPKKAAPAKTVTPAKTVVPPQRTLGRVPAAHSALPQRATGAPVAAPRPAGAAHAVARSRPATAAPNGLAAVIEQVLHWVPNSMLAELSQDARAFAGYPLLTLMLGYDPFTHKVRRRTPENLVEALLAFDKDTLELYHVVRKTGAISKAGQLIEANAARYHLGPQRVLDLFNQMVDIGKQKNLSLLIDPRPLLRPLLALAGDVGSFVAAVTPPLFDLILPLLGSRGERVMKLLKQGQATFHKIVKDPKAFLRNLVDGVKLGFKQFTNKALGYLGLSFTTWLLSAFKKDGLAMPKEFDGPSLLQLGLRLLGLTYDNLRAKLVKRMGPRGEQAVQVLETAGHLIKTLVTQGPAAVGKELLTMASGQLSKLKTQVVDGVRSWLYKHLIQEGMVKLASLLSPASALFEALRDTYETIVFFIDQADRFTALLETIVGAFSDIANRVLAPAATKVEHTLASLLTLALDWFMRLMHLGGVPEQVKAQIMLARNWIDQTIDKYLDKFIEMAVKAFNKGKQAVADTVGAVKDWFAQRKKFTQPDGQTHTLFFRGTPKQPLLMMASTEREVIVYLREELKKAQKAGDPTKAIEDALAIALKLQQMVLTTPDEIRTKGDTTVEQVELLSVAMALVGGFAPDAIPLPTKAEFDSSGANKTSTVLYISRLSAAKPAPLTSNLYPNGWRVLKDRDITANGADEQWVRMHMVSAKLAGPASTKNLIPAPGWQNLGDVQDFETKVKVLVDTNKTPPRNYPNVVWVTTAVEKFHEDSAIEAHLSEAEKDALKDAERPLFAERVSFKAGLHFFDRQHFNPQNLQAAWRKDKKEVLSIDITIKEPPLKAGYKVEPNLNNMGEERISDRTNCSLLFARLVKQVQRDGGRYMDLDDLTNRLRRAQTLRQNGQSGELVYANLLTSKFDADLALVKAAIDGTQKPVTNRPPVGKGQRPRGAMGYLILEP